MDLHANAAVSWSGRRELARRVVDEGWTLRRRPRPPVSASAALASGLGVIAPATESCGIVRLLPGGWPTGHPRTGSP
jgi:hypothetical protein